MQQQRGRRRPLGFASAILSLLVLAACDGSQDLYGGDPPGQPGLHVVSGSGVTDTIDVDLPQQLIAEVRDMDGRPLPNIVVRFETQPPDDTLQRNAITVFTCKPTGAPECRDYLTTTRVDTTDAEGRVQALIRLGSINGRAVIRIYAPTVGRPDSAVYQVLPGRAVAVSAPAIDTTLSIGTVATLRGRVVDRRGNPRTEVPTTAAGTGTAFTLDGADTVTPRELGIQWLYFRQGAFADSTRVRVLPSGRIVGAVDIGSIRLINLDGTQERVVANNFDSFTGLFPNFDATRQRVTLHAAFNGPGYPNTITVIDTNGAPRRDIDPTAGFEGVIATRQIADATVLVVGTRNNQVALWRVDGSNNITRVTLLPGRLVANADISHDGSRVTYASFDDPTQRLVVRVIAVATEVVTTVDSTGATPRWSLQDDKIALVSSGPSSTGTGTLVVVNADGTNRRVISTAIHDPGVAWSPDGQYLIGRLTTGGSLQLYRISDGRSVPLLRQWTGPTPQSNYRQPDWR